jgi:hypothetical protein
MSPGKGCIKKGEEKEKREDEEREENNAAKNKEAGSMKNICQRSTSLPRLRLGGL